MVVSAEIRDAPATCNRQLPLVGRMTGKPELIGRDSQFLYFAESPIAWINREPNPHAGRSTSYWLASRVSPQIAAEVAKALREADVQLRALVAPAF